MLQQPLWGIPPIGAIDSSTPEPAMRCHNSLPYTGLCPHKTVTTGLTDRVKMHNVRTAKILGSTDEIFVSYLKL